MADLDRAGPLSLGEVLERDPDTIRVVHADASMFVGGLRALQVGEHGRLLQRPDVVVGATRAPTSDPIHAGMVGGAVLAGAFDLGGSGRIPDV